MKLYQVAYELVGKLSSSFNTSMFSASESLQGLNNKLKDINSAQKNITGFAKLEEDAKRTSIALSEARKKFAELNNEIKASGTPTKQQSQNLETARLKVENLSNKLGSQRQKLSEVRNELKNAGINYKNLSAENERLAQSTLKAQKAQEKLRNVLSKEQALNGKRSELQGQIVGAAAVAFSLAQPIKQAMQFESSMADVKKAVDFDTPEQFAQMQQDILKMGRTLPMAHKDLAALIAAGGTAGIARKDLAKFTEDAAKMAVAFDKLSADDAGTMMANWRTAFKMSQDEVRALSDQINYLSNVTATDTTSLADIVTKVGALGDVAGVSASSVLAIGTTMGSVGVKSDVAATGIKNFMLSLVAGEAATKSQREAFKKLGLDSKKVSKDMQKDSEKTIIRVLEGVSKLNKADQATTLQQLFGKESIGAIAPLLTNLDELKKNLNAVSDSTKYAGSVNKEFEARAATTANTLQLTKNRVAEVGIKIGSVLLPHINSLLEKLNPLIDRFSEFISKNEVLVATVAGVITSFVGLKVASLALGYAWTFVSGGASILQKTYLALRSSAILAAVATKGWAAAQWLFNAAMTANPIGLIVAAIAAVIAAGVALYMHWDTVKAKFVEVWEGIKNWFSSFSLYDSGMKMLQTLADGIKAAAYAPVEAISGALGKVREYLPFSDAKVGPLSQLTLSGQKVVDTLREGMLSANPLTDDISKQLEIANSVNTLQMSQQGINIPSQKENSQNGTISSLMTKLSNIDLSNVVPNFDDITPSFKSPLGFNGLNSLDLSGLSGGSTTSMNVTYAPVINIQGTGNQQDINQAIKDGNDDFIKKLKASQEQNRRLSYV